MGLTVSQTADRSLALGASDAAAAVGQSPWKSRVELWLEKTGQAQDGPDDERRRVMFATGHHLEGPIAGLFAEVNGLSLRRRTKAMRNPRHPWQIAHVDRMIVGRREHILECKTANQWVSREWRDGVPWVYELQAHHIMAVDPKCEAVVFAALVGGGYVDGYEDDRLLIERDEEAIHALTEMEDEFWSHVETREPPPAESAADVARLHPQDADSSVEASPDDVDAHRRLWAAKDALKGWTSAKEEAEFALKQALGEAQRLVAENSDVLATWKATRDRRCADLKGMVADLKGIVSAWECYADGDGDRPSAFDEEDFEQRHMIVTAGSRRFLAKRPIAD